jgi:tetratricopeptide (TPR) repeat protein
MNLFAALVCGLALTGLIYGPLVVAEELLWCSGSNASSPLCVEFNQAMESRAEAAELKNALSKTVDPPWSLEEYLEAGRVYEEALSQFNDEYFGDSNQLYLKAIDMFERLRASLQTNIDNKKSEIMEVGQSKRFQEALSAILDIENWSGEDLSDTRSNILAMIRDEKRINTSRTYAASNDFGRGLEVLKALETRVFEDDKKQLVQELRAMASRKRFAELVKSGLTALDVQNYGSAREYFLQAKKIEPTSVTVISNLEQIEKLEKSLEIEGLKDNLDSYLKRENYGAALQVIEKLVQLDESLKLGEDRDRIRILVDLEAKIDRLMPQMVSLSSSRLRSAVEDVLRLIETMETAELGLRLKGKYEALRARYEKLGEKKGLIIRSDGKASVIIRPGGSLGQFKEIMLKVYPGEYSLVARCAGMKEKVLSVKVLSEGLKTQSQYIDCI